MPQAAFDHLQGALGDFQLEASAGKPVSSRTSRTVATKSSRVNWRAETLTRQAQLMAVPSVKPAISLQARRSTQRPSRR